MSEAEGETPRLRMLRRGRGNGFREALRAGPSAARDVISCILHDPRWDSQVEARDRYYASLLIALDADIGPIGERLLGDSDADPFHVLLPIGVLAEMARRRRRQAIDALVAVIRRGRSWLACLRALEVAGGDVLIGAVVRAQDLANAITGIDAAALVDAARIAAPWRAWAAEVPSLRFIADARRRDMAALGQPRPTLRRTMTTAELLEFATTAGALRELDALLKTRSDPSTMESLRCAATAGTPGQRMLALGILAERGCSDFVVEAENFLRDESRLEQRERKGHRTRRAFVRYLERLPPEITLALARRWYTEPWPLRLAAEHILARHATREDRVVLEDAGTAALASSDMYRLSSAIDALANVAAVESLQFFSEVYEAAPYSFARRRVVAALVAHAANPIARDLLVEALWDCEPESREIACGAVRAKEFPAAARLAEIIDDEFEEPEVRQAAHRTVTTR